jgi:hypothetical protein
MSDRVPAGQRRDVILPDFLTRCVECLEQDTDVVLAYTKTRFIDADGKTLNRQDRGLDLPSPDPAGTSGRSTPVS